MSGNRKIKILFAIPGFGIGGAEKLLVHQLAALDKTKFNPRLVTLFDERKDTFAAQVRIDACFRFHSVKDISAFFRLYRYVKREKFDVVVTSLFLANFLVRIAVILARTPVIVSYEHNIYPNKRRWQIFMDRLLARKTSRIITDSEVARVFTAQQESIPIDKFVTLHIPPLLERRMPKDAAALRRTLGIDADVPVVLTVSRFVSEKGHTYLIDSAQEVLKKFPDAVFLLVGWGPIEDELREKITSFHLEDSVKLPGSMDIQDVLPLATIYTDPAISTDLPVAIMEAMREGKATVATSVGDVPLFIEHERTGLIVRPGDAHALAQSLIRMLEDQGSRVRFGAAAKEKVSDMSLERYMRSFEELIERACKERAHNL